MIEPSHHGVMRQSSLVSGMSSSLFPTDHNIDEEEKMDVASLSSLPEANDEDNNNQTTSNDESESELKPFQKLLKQNNLQSLLGRLNSHSH